MSKITCEKVISKKLETAIKEEDIGLLQGLYLELSEEEDVQIAKGICLELYQNIFPVIIDVIKTNNDKQTMLKYYCWHFLQLMTCCTEVKEKLHKERKLPSFLIDLNMSDLGDLRHKDSLQKISLSYLIVMLGDADNDFYDSIVSSGTMPFIHNLLENSSLNSNDTMIEPLLLLLNLILEGTSSCKKQLIDLEFSELLAKKMKYRENCKDELFKIASMTHQKMLLLTSETQAFVETFRKGFQQEVKKQPVYQKLQQCWNSECLSNNKNNDNTTYKRCSKCKVAMYCSKECQANHWKHGHSKQCKPP